MTTMILSRDEQRAVERVCRGAHDPMVKKKWGFVRLAHRDLVALEQVLVRAGAAAQEEVS